MSEPQSPVVTTSAPKPSRWWPRFSLLTAILLMTIAGMGIVLAQLWNEVAPLRAEVRQMRTELGRLNVDDVDRACVLQLQTGESRHWRWRIYLPPGGDYRELCYSGMLPSPKEFHGKEWFDRVENGGTGSGMSGPLDGGEFTLDARLVKEKDRWMLRITKSGGHGTSGTNIVQRSGDWLSEESFSSSSGISAREQKAFENGEPIMLLKVVKPIVTKFSGGYSSRDPEGEAEGFVLWIEQTPIAPAAVARPPAGDR